jgi:ribonuclease HI
MAVFIYTDGGCSGNPGPGGWAYVILRAAGSPDSPGADPELIEERFGGEALTTNNRMELMAAISALERLPPLGLAPKTGAESADFRVEIHTDSQYLQKGMSEWLEGWKRRGWQSSGKTPVKNRDLWQRLDLLTQAVPVRWVWVRGHAGNEYNERCDALTQRAIAGQRSAPPPGSR